MRYHPQQPRRAGDPPSRGRRRLRRRPLRHRPARGLPEGSAPSRPADVGDRAEARAGRDGREERRRHLLRFLPRRRPLRPPLAGVRLAAPAARRVPDVLHALPARGLAGDAHGDLGVPVAHRPPDRDGRRERLGVRGGLGARRGGPDGRAADEEADAGRRLEDDPPRVPHDASHLPREPGARDRRGPGRRGRRDEPGRPSRRPSTTRPSPSPSSRRTSSASSRTGPSRPRPRTRRAPSPSAS